MGILAILYPFLRLHLSQFLIKYSYLVKYSLFLFSILALTVSNLMHW